MKNLVVRLGLILALVLSGVTQSLPAQAKTLPAPFPPANIYFGIKSAKLSAHDKAQLDKYTGHLWGLDSVKVIGYVQKGKSNKNNKSLSLARANVVASYLKVRNKYATISVEARGLPEKNVHSNKARRVTLEFSTAPVFRVTGKLQLWTYDTTLCNSLVLQEVILGSMQTVGTNQVQKRFSAVGNACEVNYQSEYIFADSWTLGFTIKCPDIATCNAITVDGKDTAGEISVMKSIPYLLLHRIESIKLVDRDVVVNVDGRPLPK